MGGGEGVKGGEGSRRFCLEELGGVSDYSWEFTSRLSVRFCKPTLFEATKNCGAWACVWVPGGKFRPRTPMLKGSGSIPSKRRRHFPETRDHYYLVACRLSFVLLGGSGRPQRGRVSKRVAFTRADGGRNRSADRERSQNA